MLNLLGCNKENFKKLIKKMGYKNSSEKIMNFILNMLNINKKLKNLFQKIEKLIILSIF